MTNHMVEVTKALGIKLNENFSDVINRLSILWKEMDACKNFTDDESKTYTEMLNTNSTDTGININDFINNKEES